MRTPDDICLLCNTNHSTKKNSHWIPMGMIKSMVGKRNYEESYQFSNFQKEKLDVYFGRSNLKNTNPEIKDNHYALDFIFCDECEEKLGRLESKVIPIIQDEIRLENKKANYAEVFSENGITHKECLRLDNIFFRLFIYSIIWRFVLIHRIEDGISIVSAETEENLRDIINKGLSLNVEEIVQKEIPSLDFQVYTADSFEDKTEGAVYTENIHKMPSFFFANQFIILFYENGFEVTGDYFYPIAKLVEAENVLNDVDENPKIGFITNAYYKQILNRILTDGAKAILNTLANEVSRCTGLSLTESRFHLATLGNEIHRKTGKNLLHSFEEAAELICEGHK